MINAVHDTQERALRAQQICEDILKNTRTPLHDHVRKVWDWSNTQTVTRFAIIQIVVSAAVLVGVQAGM